MRYEYTENELRQLHQHLYKITAEFDRICRKYQLRYFIIGGTAIGAYFWKGIIPWDDDIDIGMPRKDYERFLNIAPQELGNDFFLQWIKTDPHTPFWFAKVRENNTLFREGHFKNVDIHHGIYVDVFPFDNIPNNQWLERLQYTIFGFFNACFIGKDLWQWKHCGHCQVEEPRPRGYIGCLLTRIMVSLFSKSLLYKLLKTTQCAFNNHRTDYCKNIMTTNDKILIADIEDLKEVRLGELVVMAPRDLKVYLHTHYPVLNKNLPKEQQVNHRPAELSFNMN